MADHAEAVYGAARGISPGTVVTYGQLADMTEGVRVGPREVGGLMSVCPPDVPWHRVVGAGGRFPIGKRDPLLKERQIRLLKAEGVTFLPNGCVDMARHQSIESDQSDAAQVSS